MVKLSAHHEEILQALIARNAKGNLVGAFSGIPIEVYHHPTCPGVSSTRIKNIVERSYAHALKKQFERTAAMDFGTQFHTYMQGAEDFLARYSVGKIVPEKEFISWDVFSRIKRMHDKVMAHPVAGDFVRGSDPEKTFFSPHPVTGVLRKCRPDVLKGNAFGDYKTCMDASTAGFTRMAKKLFYRISAAFYLDTASDAQERKFNEFKFIAVESDDLHEVAVYEADDRSLERARAEIDVAMFAIANSLNGGWIGYPLHQDPIWI